MLINYLKIAWRNISKNGALSAINISGLGFAVGVFIVIGLYLQYELNFDSFLPESNRVYRVLLKKEKAELGSTSTPEPIADELEELYPEVEEAVQVNGPVDDLVLQGGGKLITNIKGIRADPGYFRVFRHRVVLGSIDNALDSPEKVVVTKELAVRLFGNRNPIGSRISVDSRREYSVSAVIQTPPGNTHLPFSLVVLRTGSEKRLWNYRTGVTYVKLKAKTDLAGFNRKLTEYVTQKAAFPVGMPSDEYYLDLQPVSEIHLYPAGDKSLNTRVIYLGVFSLIAVLILIIASINYINFTTARSLERSREIGVRKTAGATRKQLVWQILLETAMTCSLSFMLGIGLVEVSLPYINHAFNLDLNYFSAVTWHSVATLLATYVLVILLSGGYCAYIISAFNPSHVLKSGVPSLPGGIKSLRKGLVVMQFAISLVVILFSIFVYQQMEYIRSNRLDGLDSQIVVINNGSRKVSDSFETIRQQLLAHTSVLQVASGNLPGRMSGFSTFRDTTGNPTEVHYISGTHKFIQTLGIDLLSGRSFARDRDADSTRKALINQAAAEWLGIDKASGQYSRKLNRQIIGIFENYHNVSLYDPIKPTVLSLEQPGQFKSNILVRLAPGRIEEGMDTIRETWTSIEADYPLVYTFLDQNLDQMYRSELRMMKLFGGFSAIAIIISCLGLLGLAALSARKRVKEIGIRKVLGATVTDIIRLLSTDFIMMVGFGFLIAAPLVWIGISHWLKRFAYRIEVDPFLFVVVGGAMMLIALLTVGWQSIRAATANPVDSLRSE